MILEHLTIKDIGTFRDRHVFDLSPSEGAPIVLIGGKNGSGKTTILEVIQWILYGSLARTARRDQSGGSISYQRYLQELRHRSVELKGRPFAQLGLRVLRDGVDVPVVVTREISTSGSPRDLLTVEFNGEPLASPADEWPTMLDGILPVGLCPLYFFDGEQVEKLADPDSAREFLQAGLHALLGLDVIDQLSGDLGILRRRVAKTMRDTSSLAVDSRRATLERQLEDTDQEVQSVAESLRALRSEPGAMSDAKNHLSRAETMLARAEARFKRDGQDFYSVRLEVESRLRAMEVEKKSHEEELRRLADGVLPLALLRTELLQLQRDAGAEEDRQQHLARLKAADTELAELIAWLSERAAKPAFLSMVEEYRGHRAGAVSAHSVAGNERAHAVQTLKPVLDAVLADGGIAAGIREVRRLRRELSSLYARMEREDRRKATMPGDDAVHAAKDAYEAAVRDVAESRGIVDRFAETMRQLESKRIALQARREKVGQALSEVLQATEWGSRMDRSGAIAIQLLAEFRRKVAQKHLQSIQDSIWSRLRELMRKSSLGTGIRINFDTYSLELLDEAGGGIPPARLSAGERQLLATATLWGLADVARRRLPVVIDTPLGRLDRSHRENIVKNYFPRAGAQVVLLSTDEEVHGRWYQLLEGRVARSYTLEFDDREKCTRVRSGYFDEDVVHVA